MMETLKTIIVITTLNFKTFYKFKSWNIEHWCDKELT